MIWMGTNRADIKGAPKSSVSQHQAGTKLQWQARTQAKQPNPIRKLVQVASRGKRKNVDHLQETSAPPPSGCLGGLPARPSGVMSQSYRNFSSNHRQTVGTVSRTGVRGVQRQLDDHLMVAMVSVAQLQLLAWMATKWAHCVIICIHISNKH